MLLLRTRLWVMALGLLAAGGSGLSVQPEKVAARKVLDGAALFSAEARRKADAEIAEIKRLFGKDVLIETVVSLKFPADLDPKDKLKYFRKWGAERYTTHRIEGVYVLILKSPKGGEAFLGKKTMELGFFSLAQSRELGKLFRMKLKEGKDDEAVVEAAVFVRKAMEHNAAQKKEREALVQQANALFKEGKIQAASVCTEKILTIDRTVFGPESSNVVTSLTEVSAAWERIEDFAAARKTRSELVRIQAKRFGENSHQAIDARVQLDLVEKLEGLDAKGRGDFKESSRLLTEAIASNKPEKHRQGAELAEKALEIRVRILGKEDERTAVASAWAGFLWEQAGEVNKARGRYEQALAVRKKVLGDGHPDTARSLFNLGSLLQDEKKYDEARSLYEQALAIRKKVLGDHADTASSLHALGFVLERQKDYDAARTCYEQALAIRKKVFGDNHANTANSYYNLGIAKERAKDYAGARSLHEQALAIRKKVLGDSHPDTAASLGALGHLLHLQKDYAAARRYYEQALDLQKKVLGENHLDTANTLNNLGVLLEVQEDYAAARACYEQALAVRKKILGDHVDTARTLTALGRVFDDTKDYAAAIMAHEQALAIRQKVLGDHGETATSLTSLGLSLERNRDYAAARNCYEQALAMRKKVLGDKHPDVAASLTNLGVWMFRENDYASAREYDERALAIRKEALGDDHADTAESLSRVGLAIENQGDFAAARPYLEQALAVRKKVLGEEHPDTAWSLNNLGSLLQDQGDYAAARPYYERALAIQKKAHGDNHVDTVAFLSNLGLLLATQKDYAAARPHLQQAVAISKKISGENHLNTAKAIHNLGLVYQGLGEHEAARKYYEQALAIKKKALGESHPELASSLNNIANLLVDGEDYVTARRYYEQALAVHKKAMGDNHPGNFAFLNNLGWLLKKKGDDAAARKYFEQALALARRTLDLTAAAQSERQQLLMGVMLDSPLRGLIRLKGTAAELAAAYDHVLAWKGAVFARQHRLRLERAIDPKLTTLVDDLRAATSKLATLSFAVPDPKNREAWNKQLEDLSNLKEKLERELAQRSPAFRKDREQRKLTTAQLLKLLPADTALVDFLVYSVSQPSKTKKGKEEKHDHLMAFVLKPGAEIQRVDLGKLAPIEKAIDEWRAVTRKQPGKGHPGLEIRRLLWEPLEKHLAGAKTVLLSPDGPLARLPFAALPGSKPGAYLLEEVNLAVMPLPRLVTELLDSGKQAEREPSLLLVGDVDFNATAGAGDKQGRTAATRSGERKNWERLEGTRGEILSIRDSFEQRFEDGKVKVLRGEQASEATLRQLSSKYSILHLATHGFFADPKVRSALAKDDQQRGDSADAFGDKGVTGFHPGLLSGVVLAGANKPPQPGQDDGILTALEVAELDLRKVDLAVLSACETGLGKVAAGEGILGLQRAFQVAGAKTVVTSLWSVDDKATRALMERFYENMWKHKMPRAEALRQAQIWMLREGERGLERVKNQDQPSRLPPYYWAAFVVSGDWR